MTRSVPVAARLLAAAIVIFAAVYMLAPLVVVAGASINETRFLSFPPEGFTLEWYADALGSRTYGQAFQLSLVVGIATAVIATVAGTAAALALTRFDVAGGQLIQGMLMSPLTLPTIIVAIGALSIASATIGAPNIGALILVHSVIAIPYVVQVGS